MIVEQRWTALNCGDKPDRIGRPIRESGTPSARPRSAWVPTVYARAVCPYCHGPLFEAPQCIGRAVTQPAGPDQSYFMDPMPPEVIAVVCRECEQAFFPLRQSPAAGEAQGSHVDPTDAERKADS